jgi:hypothetical protein
VRCAKCGADNPQEAQTLHLMRFCACCQVRDVALLGNPAEKSVSEKNVYDS